MAQDTDRDQSVGGHARTHSLKINSDTQQQTLSTQQGDKNSLYRLSPRKPRNMKNLSLDLTSAPSPFQEGDSIEKPPTLFRARTGSNSLPFRHPSLSRHNNNQSEDFEKLPGLQRRRTTLALTIPCKSDSNMTMSDPIIATPISSLPEGLDSFPFNPQQLTSSINQLSMLDDLRPDSFRKGAYLNGPICVLEPNLYLYSEPTLDQIRKFDIVINVAKELQDFTEVINNDPSIRTNYIFVPWSHTTHICLDFPKLVNIIENGLANNLKILIHCQCGVSRSASLIVAFLMKFKNLNLNDAYNDLKNNAPLISPNMTLIFQLMEWNNTLNGKNSSSNVTTPTSSVGPSSTKTNNSLFVPSNNLEFVSSPTYSEVMN